MFIPDMPNVPPQDVPVMIAQANQAQSSTALTGRTVGICYGIFNGVGTSPSLENTIDPKVAAQSYFYSYEQRTVTGSATITILQQPAHGILRLITEADGNNFGEGQFDPADPGYVYLPEKGYIGQDKAVILVEIGGVKVKEIFYFHVIVEQTSPTSPCGGSDGIYSTWKISSTLAPNGTSTITSVDYQTPATAAAGTPVIPKIGVRRRRSGSTIEFADDDRQREA